ncbi:MFS general substrate transporter [Mycena amicta]|nr:MFS general substrate transporter [Mycena amicta]
MDATSKSLDIERKTSTPDHELGKALRLQLLRKFDFLILPPLALIYLCNSLDKGNVGNAKTAGWDKDIGLKGDQYYILVMTFYGTPLSLFAKRFSAARVLPIMMLGFVSQALCTAAAKNFSQVFAIRFFLGIFESPMLPAVVSERWMRNDYRQLRQVYYLSTFYKRDELASRISIFYAAASIASAFSGLIAYGVFHLTGSRYHNWQVSGGRDRCFATFAWFWLPRTPATWGFLTDRQKAIARTRILSDSSTVVEEGVEIAGAFGPFKRPTAFPLASVNNFLPQIIASFKYSTVKTNLYTATAMTGFIILGCIDTLKHLHVAYFACFLLTIGAFAPSVLVATWYSYNNTTQESKRAVVAAVMIAFANSAGLISTNVFRAQDEPKYVPALATSGDRLRLVSVWCWWQEPGIWMRRENARRNREQGVNLQAKDVNTSNLPEGHKSPLFRYMY